MTQPVTRIEVGGVGLETRWIGPGPEAAPTIVMLHEGLGSIRQWGTWPESLAEATGCGVFLYSRAGYGGSDPVALPRPLHYMHDEAMTVLPAVLDRIGFRRGILLGHSDGASIATIYAGGVEDFRVRGLALIALDPGFRAWDIRESIGYIRVPILIVQGGDDQYGTTAQLDAAREEAYCPVDVALLPGTGHAPHLERPAETLAAVAGFVNTLFRTFEERAANVG